MKTRMGPRLLALAAALAALAALPSGAWAESGWIDSFSALDIRCRASPEEGFSAGGENTLRIEVYNYGNVHLKETQITLSLPEGVTPRGKSATEPLGMLASGDKKALTFALDVEKNLEAKPYPVTVQASGTSYEGQSVSASKTFYIPVEGVRASDLAGIEIGGIRMPEEVKAGDTFTMSFTVTNRGSRSLPGMKISAEPPEGVYNLSRSAFLDDFGPGQSRTYSMTFSTFRDSEAKGCAVKLTASPSGKDGDAAVSQYAATRLRAGSGTVKTPLLMISGSGGGKAQAGSRFQLDLSVRNTSDRRLTNIRLSLSAEESALLPADGSSSLYLESAEPGETKIRSIAMAVRPDAAQKPTGITVSMSYEDGEGNAYTSEDTVSVQVEQSSRLSAGEFTAPYEAYAGNPCSGEIEFYNMGKTALNNLTVRAEGNFDSAGGSLSYYAGNMASGGSDSFSFGMVPREPGPVEGEVIFSWEDGGGQAHETRKSFSFQASEMPAYEEEFPMEEEQEQKFPRSLVIAGAALLLLAAAALAFRRRRKKKREAALELDDGMDI